MIPFRLVSDAPDATRQLGAAVGRACTGLIACLLCGDYGSGKTTFVQGLAAGLGITGPVRSPSYNIARRYENGRLPLVHADLYRAGSLAEVDELGLTEMLGESGVLAVEWPGEFGDAFSHLPFVLLSFALNMPASSTSENQRAIEVEWSADCPPAVREALRAFAP